MTCGITWPILDKSLLYQKRSITQIQTRPDPKNRGKEPKSLSKRAHNPLRQNEAGLIKPTAHPGLRLGARPFRGPGPVWAIGTTGMPLTAGGRERLPHSDAYKQAPRSWVAKGLPQLGFDLFGDTGRAFGRVHSGVPRLMTTKLQPLAATRKVSRRRPSACRGCELVAVG